MSYRQLMAVSASLLTMTSVSAEEVVPVDGRYDARVTTDSGTYIVPVEVQDGEVRAIRWPNGGRMRVRGAELDDGEAIGRNWDGDRVRIEIDGMEYETPGDGFSLDE